MANKPIFPTGPIEKGLIINNASGTNTLTLLTSTGHNKITYFTAYNGDTVDVVLNIYRKINTVLYKCGEVTAKTGVSTDILSTLFGNVPFNVGTGNELCVAAKTTVTSGKQIDIIAEAGAY